jgi:ribosomal protein S18 acetylase RimI-like enzyme
MSHDIQIQIATNVDADLAGAMGRLIGELSASAVAPTAAELQEIVSAGATTLLLARDHAAEGRIVGMLTLAVFRIPTGLRAWIEDVVVDAAVRGRGVGEALIQEAVLLAREGGVRSVDLTSRPSREAANRLYQRLGFRLRETNVYRLELSGPV